MIDYKHPRRPRYTVSMYKPKHRDDSRPVDSETREPFRCLMIGRRAGLVPVAGA